MSMDSTIGPWQDPPDTPMGPNHPVMQSVQLGKQMLDAQTEMEKLQPLGRQFYDTAPEQLFRGPNTTGKEATKEGSGYNVQDEPMVDLLNRSPQVGREGYMGKDFMLDPSEDTTKLPLNEVHPGGGKVDIALKLAPAQGRKPEALMGGNKLSNELFKFYNAEEGLNTLNELMRAQRENAPDREYAPPRKEWDI